MRTSRSAEGTIRSRSSSARSPMFAAVSYTHLVPNMLYELVAGGILTTAFLPVYLSVKSSRGDGAAWRFASNLFNIALVALGAVVILATLFAPQVIATQTFMTPGESADQAVFFFRFFAVQVLFLGLGALAGGILNAHRCYFWPNVSAAFNNLVVIVTFFGYVPLSAWDAGFARVWLAVGTTLGSVAMFACLVPSLMKVGISYTPRIDLHDPALREVARIALPVVVFTVANLVAVSFRNAFALDVAANGPSTIQYAWMWYQLPYGIVAAALSIALFTELSDFAAQGNWARFKDCLLYTSGRAPARTCGGTACSMHTPEASPSPKPAPRARCPRASCRRRGRPSRRGNTKARPPPCSSPPLRRKPPRCV